MLFICDLKTGIVGAVQNHYSITEGQVGFLQTVFVTSYMVCSPIFGYFGDRYSRKWIMVIGTTLSMVAVFTGSFMEDYTSFLIMRAILGVGQASFATVSPTKMTRNPFPTTWRPWPFPTKMTGRPWPFPTKMTRRPPKITQKPGGKFMYFYLSLSVSYFTRFYYLFL